MSELVLSEELSQEEINLLQKSALDYVLNEGLKLVDIELISTRCKTIPSFLFVPKDLIPTGF